MSEFQELLQQQLKKPKFKKELNDIQPEMEMIKQEIKKGATQNEKRRNVCRCNK